MRRVILYIAMSLDGYIADESGGVNWLEGHQDSKETDTSYEEFIKQIDIVIMGRKTYEQIINELSPGKWVYNGLKSYIVTSKNMKKDENVEFIKNKITDFIQNIKKEHGKDVWIVGGAKLANMLIRENLIDEYHIAIIPIILGKGILLFEKSDYQKRLHLIKQSKENGFVMLKYKPIQ